MESEPDGAAKQRNGRIDRELQPNAEVYCYYFFYKQRPEDRILAALVRKTKTIREELGSLAQVIDSRLDTLMKSGIRRKEIGRLEREIESADGADTDALPRQKICDGICLRDDIG